MASFDFTKKHLLIVDGNHQSVELKPHEGLDLLHWLSDHEEILLSFLNLDEQKHFSDNKRIEILLYPQDLEHLDELRAAIPGLHEVRTIVKVFDAGWDPVIERAIELLKELQLEYKIHPLLEE